MARAEVEQGHDLWSALVARSDPRRCALGAIGRG